MVEMRVNCHVFSDAAGCAQFLANITEIIESPTLRNEPQSLLTATTKTKKRAVRDGDFDVDGHLYRTVFRGMLMQVPGLSWDVATAVSGRYSTIAAIVNDIQTFGAEHVCGEMEELWVHRESSRTRRKIGRALSNKIIDVFTSHDPTRPCR